MAQDRAAINNALIMQVNQARERANAARSAAEQARQRRSTIESEASDAENQVSSLTSERDRYAGLYKTAQEEGTKYEGEFNTQKKRYDFLIGQTADLENMGKNIDSRTNAKINELAATQTQPTDSGGALPSQYAPSSTFGESESSFTGLRNKVRAGFAGEVRDPARPDEIFNRGRKLMGGSNGG